MGRASRYTRGVLAGGLLGLAALAPGDAMAAFPGQNGRIAYVAYLSGPPPDGGFDIFTVLPDGSEPRRLTNLPGNAVQPSWSPDGRTIVFVNSTSEGSSLWTMNSEGGEQARLIGGPAASPSFSPSGRRIVYSSGDAIRVVRTDGAPERRVAMFRGESCCVFDPVYAPEGNRIVFGRGTSGGYWGRRSGIWSIRRDGSGLRRLTKPDRPDYDTDPDFRPNGRRIVFDRHRREILSMRADGSQERPIPGHPSFYAFDPAFSPTGDRIVGVSVDYFTIAKTPCSRLFTVSVDGGDTHYQPGGCSYVATPNWQPLPAP